MQERAGPSVEELFQEVLDRGPAFRVNFLEQRIPNDEGMRRRVLALIGAYELAGGEFNERAPQLPPEHESHPERVGRYPIEAQLAEGGMSIVYLARQEQPSRRIALKVIRPSLASENMLARFELEAAVLARLRHPGIAHVYDAGRTVAHFADGHTEPRAFMAMELIEGEPVTTFARARGLSLGAKLALVAEICDALHAAHQQGVIHRDLKPANILIDKQERAKILDFGAAAFVSELWADTPDRALGGVAGTGPYLSPEHASEDGAELDTRSDVYSMGVVLYELIAGRTPRAMDGLPGFEAARRVRETEIVPLVESAPGTPADLAMVVNKALARSKENRYDSAADFAADLRRFLTNQPVLAHPPSALYGVRMLVKRRTGLVTAGAVAALSLVMVAAVAVQQAIVASREADAKARALAIAADARDEAEGAADFLVRMLSSSDPGELGRDITVRELLERVAPDLNQDFEGRPSSEARAREAIGRTYVGLGDFDAAIEQLERAHEIRARMNGEDHLTTVKGELALATAMLALDRVDEAEHLFQHAAVVIERDAGTSDPDLVAALVGLADSQIRLQDFTSALEVYKSAIKHGEAREGGLLAIDLHALTNYAFALARLGRTAEAAEIYRVAVPQLRDTLGADHPTTLSGESGAAVVMQALGRTDEAEAQLREILASSERVRGPEHADTFGAANNLARLFAQTGRYTEAKPLYERVIAGAERTLGPFHRNTLKARFSLAQAEFFANHFAQCRDELLPVLELQRLHLGAEHVDIADTLQVLAAARANLGEHKEAEATFAESIAMFSKLLSPDDPITHGLRAARAGCLMQLGRNSEALSELETASAALPGLGPKYRPGALRALEQLVTCYRALGREDDARRALGQLEKLRSGVETSTLP